MGSKQRNEDERGQGEAGAMSCGELWGGRRRQLSWRLKLASEKQQQHEGPAHSAHTLPNEPSPSGRWMARSEYCTRQGLRSTSAALLVPCSGYLPPQAVCLQADPLHPWHR